MSENLIDGLIKRLEAKTIHELRQLGRAIGVPHPADGKKGQLLEEITAIATAKKDVEPQTNRGAPPKSQEYDRRLASDILRCREIYLAKNLPAEEPKPISIFVANSSQSSLDYIGGGILEFNGEVYFLRTSGGRENFASDVFVNKHFVNTYNLREGDFVEGRCKRNSPDEMAGLASVLKINGLQPSNTTRPEFDNFVPVYADKKLVLECSESGKTGRIIDLFAPIGAGQRVLVVSPPGCGTTKILKDIAVGIRHNNGAVKLVIALIDVSPEDATDFSKSFKGADVFTSPFDAGTAAHIRTMRLALEYSKRQTELGQNVVLIVDDLTRLARAYNASTRQAAAGLNFSAVDTVKKILAAARNTEEGASLTVISALTAGSGDLIEDEAYSALKEVCNAKITLSLQLARYRIYPPIDFGNSYSVLDERLHSEREMTALLRLRNKNDTDIAELFSNTENNSQLIDLILR